MSNIGIFHYKVGSTDGVSLEIDKWKLTLEDMGHTVFLCAGNLGSTEGTLIEEMYHHTPEAERLYLNTFNSLIDYPDNTAYESALLKLSEKIENKLDTFVIENKIDFFFPNNILSVGANPAATLALANVIRKHDLPVVAHHHDFYFERFGDLALTCRKAVELADKNLPPRSQQIKHVVISKIAQKELMDRKGIESSVVPNVFNFDCASWKPDDYNRDFRENIGLRKKDVFILQAVRIVPRKGIELAIDLISALNEPQRRASLKKHGLYDGREFDSDSRIVLVLAGYSEDDLTGGYMNALKEKIKQAGVDAIFISDKIRHSRLLDGKEKKYSLWDTYIYADMVVYSSLWEGWGNQLLEAVYARLPTVIFEYPVYLTDIKDKGFRFISMGSRIAGKDNRGMAYLDKKIIGDAADHIVEYLTNNDLRVRDTEHNYMVGKKHYSYQALRQHLEKLI
jgi:glycosyltransferase involved in cell wall biosynthesis